MVPGEGRGGAQEKRGEVGSSYAEGLFQMGKLDKGIGGVLSWGCYDMRCPFARLAHTVPKSADGLC